MNRYGEDVSSTVYNKVYWQTRDQIRNQITAWAEDQVIVWVEARVTDRITPLSPLRSSTGLE
jgi:hypothetical protein